MEDFPPGFRFHPTEEELVSFYLHNKLEGKRQDLNRIMDRVIPVIDIYDFNPWDLPQLAGELWQKEAEQWFFFMERKEREARGGRPKRLTVSGYWKATGSPTRVYSSNNRIIGLNRTMVFYNGRAPHGTKTDWKMNEYKATDPQSSSSSSSPSTTLKLRQEFSLCRIYKKSKGFRAFDRRPRPQQTEIGRPYSHQFLEVPPMAVETRTISPESSSSGDRNHGFPTGESSNSRTMEIDDEPQWDWDQLDWL